MILAVRSYLILCIAQSSRILNSLMLVVRLEPTLIELEREQEDLLIISHASVIRCLLAYLIGLPASEIPAIEIARGDLLEVCTLPRFKNVQYIYADCFYR